MTNGAKSSCQPVASGVPQGLAVGQMLFIVFNNDLEDRMKYTLSKYVHDTKLGGAVNTLEERAALETGTCWRNGLSRTS